MSRNLSCSFCGKSEHEVAKLVAGPNVHICDVCVGLAQDLIDSTPNDPNATAPSDSVRSGVFAWLRQWFRSGTRGLRYSSVLR